MMLSGFAHTSGLKAPFQIIPNRANRKKKFRWTKAIYSGRYLVERFFNKLKQIRRIAARYAKLGATFFAFVQLASVRIWLRSIESSP